MSRIKYTLSKYFIVVILILLLLSLTACREVSEEDRHELLQTDERYKQMDIARVEDMPNMPEPFRMRDWKEAANTFDKLVFDFQAEGPLLPIIWWDKSRKNFDQDIFGLPAYMGDNRQNADNPDVHEGITALSSVMGATLVGIDKSNQNGNNYVKMVQNFYNKDNGLNIVMDSTSHHTGSFWYDLLPGMMFSMITHYYPDVEGMDEVMRGNADSWYEAAMIMETAEQEFEYSYFNFKDMQPVNNGSHIEPDSSAGIAWTQYMAYQHYGDEKYLSAAKVGMNYLEQLPTSFNPYYEILLPYGAYLAARMNAEQGTSYNMHKMLDWSFNGDTSVRGDAWGVLAEKWGDMDVHGLSGGLTNGYAFAMNTYSMAGALAPITRYDARYARTIGKFILNAANNARLFYPDELPDDNQSDLDLKSSTQNAIAYEGLRRKWGLAEPFATGDARTQGWAKSNFSIYGSAWVGVLGGLISKTDDEKILKIDTVKTDYYHDDVYPTYLYYNPYDTTKDITIELGDAMIDIYDTVHKTYISKNVSGSTTFTMEADSARVLVIVPAEGITTTEGNKMLVDGVVVDYMRLQAKE